MWWTSEFESMTLKNRSWALNIVTSDLETPSIFFQQVLSHLILGYFMIYMNEKSW